MCGPLRDRGLALCKGGLCIRCAAMAGCTVATMAVLPSPLPAVGSKSRQVPLECLFQPSRFGNMHSLAKLPHSYAELLVFAQR